MADRDPPRKGAPSPADLEPPHPDSVRWVGSARLLSDPTALERAAVGTPWTSTEDITPADERKLRGLLDRLLPKDREILTMVYLEAMSQRDIAARLGITQQSVWERLHSALARARNLARVAPFDGDRVRAVALGLGLDATDADLVAAWWVTPNARTVARSHGTTRWKVEAARARFLSLEEADRKRALEAALVAQGVERLRRVRHQG